ncbi:LacI family DNA-binding transcriptional regulator [Devosia sp.]|uniref:LacI family DNA-binding transcriptional regulator n=1 Tax=Devosia sp. TaxID=1871048 RepID=UPI003A904D5D
MRRPTITDLAREAGVSVATVDRVLNGRARVREDTALKVRDAANRVGYHGATAIGQRVLAHQPQLRLGIILQKQRHDFYRELADNLRAQLAATTSHRVQASVVFAETTLPSELTELLHSFAGKVDAVAATGLDNQQVTAAVSALRAQGIPVFSLLSDFAQGVRESYVGLNNLKAGRTAGWLMAGLCRQPGKVGIFIGGHRFHGHELRETGFRSSLREYGAAFELLNPQVNLESRQLTYEATLEVLESTPDLVGIYCAGGGMEGAIAALRETRQPGQICLMVHELTAETQRALQDGFVSIVISTPLRELCAELTGLMIHAVDNGMADTPGQRFLPFQIWTPESL